MENNLEEQRKALSGLSKIYNTKNELFRLNALKNASTSDLGKLFGTDKPENITGVMGELAELGEEKVKELTIEEVKTLLGKYEIQTYSELPDELLFEFVGMLTEGYGQLVEAEEEIAKLTKSLAEQEELYYPIIEKYGDVLTMIRNHNETLLQQKDITDEAKETIEANLFGMDEASDFHRVKAFYTEIGAKNTLGDFKDASRRKAVLKRYNEAIAALGFKRSLASFVMLEEKLLPEKYHGNKNLFLFVMMKFIGSQRYVIKRPENRVFINTLIINLESAYSDRMTDANRERFIKGICSVMDMFI